MKRLFLIVVISAYTVAAEENSPTKSENKPNKEVTLPLLGNCQLRNCFSERYDKEIEYYTCKLKCPKGRVQAFFTHNKKCKRYSLSITNKEPDAALDWDRIFIDEMSFLPLAIENELLEWYEQKVSEKDKIQHKIWDLQLQLENDECIK